MILNTLISIAIILLFVYVGVLCYSFFSTSIKNHYKFKHLFQVSVLNIFQAFLGIYFIITGDDVFQEARWISFSFMEMAFLYFIMRSYKNRHFELIITSVYLITLLLSTLWLNLAFNMAIVAMLVLLSLFSNDEILKKWFSISFALYGMTSIIPSVFGFTQVESLLMGLVFSVHFTVGVWKLYHKERTDDELKKLIMQEKL